MWTKINTQTLYLDVFLKSIEPDTLSKAEIIQPVLNTVLYKQNNLD